MGSKLFVYVYMAVVVLTLGLCEKECTHWNPITKARVGAHVLIQTRKLAHYNSESCLKDAIMFLKANPASHYQTLKPKILAKLWLTYYREKWNNTFYGAADSVTYFQNGKAINVLVDRDISIQRFILINSLTNTLHLEYKSEDQAFALFTDNPLWQNYDILECQHLLHYLAKTHSAHRTTFTIIRRNSSVEEDELIGLTGGIAGFIKE